MDAGSQLRLELTNTTTATLRSVEILTIFLKDELTPGGGPSQAHIRFEPIDTIQPRQNVQLLHQTWIKGKPAGVAEDQMARLKTIEGEIKPYVLDISWRDHEGRTCFQRIPVGH